MNLDTFKKEKRSKFRKHFHEVETRFDVGASAGEENGQREIDAFLDTYADELLELVEKEVVPEDDEKEVVENAIAEMQETDVRIENNFRLGWDTVLSLRKDRMESELAGVARYGGRCKLLEAFARLRGEITDKSV